MLTFIDHKILAIMRTSSYLLAHIALSGKYEIYDFQLVDLWSNTDKTCEDSDE